MKSFFGFCKRLSKNRLAVTGALVFAIVVVLAAIAPWISRYQPEAMSLASRLKPPSKDHPFGTDEMGRDVLTRILYGARISLSVAFSGVLIGGTIGTIVGLVAGYGGGRFDSITMRIMDVALAFPSILQSILIITVLGPGLQSVVVAIAIFCIPVYSRTVRGAVLSLKEMEYVEAARAIGRTETGIMFRHVLPNTLPVLIVQTSLMLASAMLVASSLSFIGLGAQPPTPEWGAMLASSRAYLRTAPWVSVFPGLAITISVLGLNLLGDGLRDLLDPRLKQ
jgi:peptide/nickel transport system permease protein